MGKGKHTDRLGFEKRHFRENGLGQIMPAMLRKLGTSSSHAHQAAIIRITAHWADIIGHDLAEKSIPLRITSRKTKNRQTDETETFYILKILAESAFGTVIAMREALIVQRLNRFLGHDRFSAIVIEHGTVLPAPAGKAEKPVQVRYTLDLPEIDDPVLKNRLESLGQAVKNRDNKDIKGQTS